MQKCKLFKYFFRIYVYNYLYGIKNVYTVFNLNHEIRAKKAIRYYFLPFSFYILCCVN